MWELFQVAIRNVGRNKRRTLITVITTFIGVVVTLNTRGLLNGLQGEIKSGLTRKIHGDLQVHKPGYADSLESTPYKALIPFDAGTRGRISTTLDIEATAPRLRVMGLFNHQKSQTTTPVMITGIDTMSELAVCPRLAQSVQMGSMLDSKLEKKAAIVSDDNLAEAGGLDSASTGGTQAPPISRGFHQVMVTPGLMRGLGAQLGDEVVILFQDKENMQQALVAQIVATVDYGMPNANNRMAWMDFKTLQDTLHIAEEVSELAVRIAPTAEANVVRERLAQALGSGFVVETWLDVAGFFRDAMGLQDIVFSAVLVIMFTIVVSAIVNTSLMTVMERTREIGTLMALGYRRSHILFLFLSESAFIGILGGVIGVAASTLILAVLQRYGIHLALPGQAVQTVLFPFVTLRFIGLVLTLSLLSSLTAGILPAYRASRMKPVVALNSV